MHVLAVALLAAAVVASASAATAAATSHTAAAHAAPSVVTPDAAIVGHWCDAVTVVIAIDARGVVEMDGHGSAQCALLPDTNARKVRCTYKHLPDRVHVYDLMPGITPDGKPGDEDEMQMELHWETSVQYHALRRCNDELVHAARAVASGDASARSAATEWLPSEGANSWKIEGDTNPNSRFFSRRMHRVDWIERSAARGARSIAIGRGYQLGLRTPAEIRSDLAAAGCCDDAAHVDVLVGAAGLSGVDADAYMAKHGQVRISVDVERRLFAAQYARARADIVRERAKGERTFLQWPASVREFMVDLEFSHHLTAALWERLRRTLAESNWHALLYLLSEHAFWIEDVGLTQKRHAMHERVLANVITEAAAAQQLIPGSAAADEL